jgi:hypothetical protein
MVQPDKPDGHDNDVRAEKQIRVQNRTARHHDNFFARRLADAHTSQCTNVDVSQADWFQVLALLPV